MTMTIECKTYRKDFKACFSHKFTVAVSEMMIYHLNCSISFINLQLFYNIQFSLSFFLIRVLGVSPYCLLVVPDGRHAVAVVLVPIGEVVVDLGVVRHRANPGSGRIIQATIKS